MLLPLTYEDIPYSTFYSRQHTLLLNYYYPISFYWSAETVLFQFLIVPRRKEWQTTTIILVFRTLSLFAFGIAGSTGAFKSFLNTRLKHQRTIAFCDTILVSRAVLLNAFLYISHDEYKFIPNTGPSRPLSDFVFCHPIPRKGIYCSVPANTDIEMMFLYVVSFDLSFLSSTKNFYILPQNI